MSIATVNTRAKLGIEAPPVSVETHISSGLPKFTIVGLPETAVKESKDRVRSAIINSGFRFPKHRITVNLAPADLPKEGGRYDLPIALSLLLASNQLPAFHQRGQQNGQQQDGQKYTQQDIECIGELGLSGQLKPVRGILPVSIYASQNNKALILPEANADEAALPHNAKIIAAKSLTEVCSLLTKPDSVKYWQKRSSKQTSTNYTDLSDIKGQQHAKRALEITAAGNHNMLMQGPPGSGKTMLATRLLGILPPLDHQEMLEVASIHSISTQNDTNILSQQRPFRNPHHTASAIALVGGGSNPRPGEISLAHKGVLFLDELAEFDRKVLDVLRQPIETGEIIISRATQQVRFPADFQLIAAMNPCPSGYKACKPETCRCSVEQVKRYRARISGPLLDRIDIHIEVPPVPINELTSNKINKTQEKVSKEETGKEEASKVETSKIVAERVYRCRKIQYNRTDKTNAELGVKEIDQHCKLTSADQKFLTTAIDKLQLSARSYHKILKLARTIADLDQAATIAKQHLIEAVSFRNFDRFV